MLSPLYSFGVEVEKQYALVSGRNKYFYSYLPFEPMS